MAAGVRGQYRVLPSMQHWVATLPTQTGVVLRPTGYGTWPTIGPLEQNIPVTVDLTPVSTLPLSALTVTASMVQDVGGTARTTDVTASFVRASSYSGSLITLTLGNGTQQSGSAYTVELTVTLGGATLQLPLSLRCLP